MGVDANVITAERIKEELRSGKSLDGALKSGFARGLTPIIDGNVTIVIVAIVLMGAFGPSDGLFAKALHFVFFAFGPSTAAPSMHLATRCSRAFCSTLCLACSLPG